MATSVPKSDRAGGQRLWDHENPVISPKQQKTEFGDFQTPDGLAKQAVAILSNEGRLYKSIVEPTCGVGSFLLAAGTRFPNAERLCGMDVNATYVNVAQQRAQESRINADVAVHNFFEFDWRQFIDGMPEPILVVGNPPWVTSAQLGVTGGTNLPLKENFQNQRGVDAITGKANFDIAEWMLLKLLEAVSHRRATIAFLVKTSVARRVLLHAWKNVLPLIRARLIEFDASKHFGVSVSAGLLVCEIGEGQPTAECQVSVIDMPDRIKSVIGWRQGTLVADAAAYDQCIHLLIDDPERTGPYRWRSGVKHDCAQVMELRKAADGSLVNGAGELVEIESRCVFPLLKGSDIANRRVTDSKRFVIVTQSRTGEDTVQLSTGAPRTWAYLMDHQTELNNRRSSIYRGRPPFSVFGVGPYTFAPWKVGVSALYKQPHFVVIPPAAGKPVVLDDTAYQLSCEREPEARLLEFLLNSPPVAQFLRAFTFGDAKRPLTVDVLQRLDIAKLAAHLGRSEELAAYRSLPEAKHTLPF